MVVGAMDLMQGCRQGILLAIGLAPLRRHGLVTGNLSEFELLKIQKYSGLQNMHLMERIFIKANYLSGDQTFDH
jgi:hypothetical protein